MTNQPTPPVPHDELAEAITNIVCNVPFNDGDDRHEIVERIVAYIEERDRTRPVAGEEPYSTHVDNGQPQDNGDEIDILLDELQGDAISIYKKAMDTTYADSRAKAKASIQAYARKRSILAEIEGVQSVMRQQPNEYVADWCEDRVEELKQLL